MNEQKEEQKTIEEKSPFKKIYEAEVTLKIQLSDEEINTRKKEIFEELEELLARNIPRFARINERERIVFEEGKLPLLFEQDLPPEIQYSYYDNLTKHTVYLTFDKFNIYTIEHILEYGMSLPPIQKLQVKFTVYGFYP